MRYSYRGGWGGPSYRAYGGYGGWGLTPMVKKLILVNAAIFLGLAVLGGFSRPLVAGLVGLLGVVPRDVVFGLRLWQPLTYLFLHLGFWHLFFNMFALWMFGSPLERDWGSRRFLRYYLLTGVGAGILNVVVTLLWGGRAAIVPTIGASGAIYGILLAFGLLYPHQPIFLWFLFPIPARIFVLIFGAIAFVSALGGPGSGVSHVSHLGGMLFGYLYLRGGWRGLYRGALDRYVDWRMKQSRRKFDVSMHEQDEDEREIPRHDRWIH
ncbi:MAG: rhomboid family intramembrane serine protease [Terriglobia bacterium]